MIGTGDGDERLQLALQTGKIGVWDWDLIQDRISWSESLHLIHGVDRAATPSLALFLELVHPDDRERVAAAIRATLDGHSPHELELRAIRPNGETIWLFINAMVIRHDGHPVRMLGATIDVTDRKRTEMRLRESEERFAKAFNASPLSLTISSLLSGRLIEVNETFTVVSGYSREEALGRTTAELGLWAKLSDREQELGLIRASGRVRNAEYCFRNRHGQEIVGLLSAECIEIAGE
ncbi:MAG TPA: PAS domain S-box protein, partial [Terriglobales bacterium]|nr:PAS domain S-box protein [Terriglobales bacterium]